MASKHDEPELQCRRVEEGPRAPREGHGAAETWGEVRQLYSAYHPGAQQVAKRRAPGAEARAPRCARWGSHCPPWWGMSCLVASLLAVGASTDRSLLPDLSLAELASRRAQLLRAKNSQTDGGKRSIGRQTKLEKIDPTHFAIFWAYDGFKGDSPLGIFPAPPEVKPASSDGGGDGGDGGGGGGGDGGDGGGGDDDDRGPSRPVQAPAKSIDKVAAAGDSDKLVCDLGYVAATWGITDAWCTLNCGASGGCLGDALEVCMCDSKFLHAEKERQQQETQQAQQQAQQQVQQAQPQPEEPLMADYWPPPSSPEPPPPTPPPMPSSPPSPPPPPSPPSPPPGTPAPVPKMPTWGDTAEEDCPRFCFQKERAEKPWVHGKPAYCSYVSGCKRCWACGPKVAEDAYSAAAQCWRDSVCRCKIFAECEGNVPDDTSTQATKEYPLHDAEHYCYKYALCGDDLPEHLRGKGWKEGGARAPAQTAKAAPHRLLSSSIPRSPAGESPRRHRPAEEIAPEMPDLRVESQTQSQLEGLQHSIRTAAAVTFAARIIFSNPQVTPHEDEHGRLPRLLKCADFPDEQRCESGHTLPKRLYPGKLYVVQNHDFDFSELDSLSRLIGEAASVDSRGDLLEHSRGNNFRFVAPAALEAAGIKHALYLDGDTCIADVAGVSRWMRSPVESAAEAAKRQVTLTLTLTLTLALTLTLTLTLA